MPDTPAHRVFVSYTARDLREHAAAVSDVISRLEWVPIDHRNWAPTGRPSVSECREQVLSCQILVVLVAHRYGWVPATEEGGDGEKSIAWLEVDVAREAGLEVIPFLVEDEAPWPADLMEGLEDAVALARLNRFKQELRRSVSGSFSTPVTLEGRLAIALQRAGERLQGAGQEAEAAKRTYRDLIRHVHGTIQFLELPHSRSTPDIGIDRLYVEAALSKRWLSSDTPPEQWRETRSLLEMVAEHSRLVILGDPGSGKSTLVSWVAWQLASEEENDWTASLGRLLPLPLVLRQFNLGHEVSLELLLDSFVATPLGRPLAVIEREALLEEGAVVLLDGVDEIGSVEVRRELRAAVWDAMNRYPGVRWIVTSRVVGYEEMPFHRRDRDDRGLPDEADTGEPPDAELESLATLSYLAPFDDERIASFAAKWFAVRECAGTEADEFVEAVRADDETHRLGRIPNLLTLMALIFREATLPDGRAALYTEIADAYLESIDAIRRLPGPPWSLLQRKMCLSRVGYKMQCRRAQSEAGSDESSVSAEQVRRWVADEMEDSEFGDPARAGDFVDFVARRSGLLLSRGEDLFAFQHLSFQEYFAAVYQQRQVIVPDEESAPFLAQTRNDAALAVWREALVFLFELIAREERPWRDKLRDALFGSDFAAVRSRPGAVFADAARNRATLLARVAVDPHSCLSDADREVAMERCWRFERQLLTDEPAFRAGVRPTVAAVLLGAPEASHGFVRASMKRALADVELLNLTDTAITDLGLLSHLENLSCLYLIRFRGKGLDPISGLKRLSKLYLRGADVADLEPLSSLRALTRLDLTDTRVDDLRAVTDLENLSKLDLGQTDVTDLGSLSSLHNLTALDLERTRVTDLSPLSNLKNLAWINLSRCEVEDLSPLSALGKLSTLILDHTPVKDLEALSDLRSLASLSLRGSRVTSLQPLSSLPRLASLDLRDSHVTDLSPLANLPKLFGLDVRGSGVGAEEVAGVHTAAGGHVLKGEADELSKLQVWTPRSEEAAGLR